MRLGVNLPGPFYVSAGGRRRRRGRGARFGFWQFVGVLIVVGILVKYWWLGAIVCLLVAAVCARVAVASIKKRRARERQS